jgi:hypothetical protein
MASVRCWDHQAWERHARKLKRRPLVKHEHNCCCGGVFRCSQCGHYVGWCQGGSEDDYCAECSNRIERAKEV